MSPKPLLPSFGHVRLATLEDLPRIAPVAAAGFFWSPTFQFQRPLHAKFPNDTIASYWDEYQAAIRDPGSVVIVAEDLVDEKEDGGVYEALRTASAYSACLVVGVQVVVGVCSINLRPGSPHIGQFQSGSKLIQSTCSNSDKVLTDLSRDVDDEAARLYNEATAPAKAKYLAGLMRLSTLAVHPTYWGRGHATRLVDWCARLADIEYVPLGVSAAPMGATVAAKAGFKECELVQVKRSEEEDAEVTLWVAVRQPSRSRPTENTMQSETPPTDSE
ncbi:hypothetical protein BDV95DRAFT_491126 [Massariosphaeria phaeospora]|uniref:N-acetyltransferase domain-containing protein n=1 Tax=Massariosphaeria phaeospora TaxID=100035 RepID=A0A7C8MBX5_9PLEO|nr:hypothetical protein BDV95DRAFT_491126 [Massariosphaeria phaeospora]